MRSPLELSLNGWSAALLLLAALVQQTATAQSLESAAEPDPAGAFQPLRGHSETIHSLAYAPDGRTLVSAGAGSEIQFWRLGDDQTDATERARRAQLLVDVNHPRFAIRQRAFEELAQLGVAIKPALLERLESQPSPESDLRMRRLIAMADIPQGIGHSREVRGVAVSPDGKTAASAGRDNVIGLWDVAIGRAITAIHGHSDGVWCVAFSPDGRQLASGGGDHQIRIWNVNNQLPSGELKGHESTVHDLEFSRDAQVLVSAGGFDQTVRVWDLNSSRCLHVLDEHTDAVMCLSISPDGQQIASGGYDGRIYLWDLAGGTLIRSFAAHQGIIRDMAFSPRDPSQLISVGDDRLAHRWDGETGRKVATYRRHRSGVRAIAFAPNGASFATAGRYGVIHRWPIEP